MRFGAIRSFVLLLTLQSLTFSGAADSDEATAAKVLRGLPNLPGTTLSVPSPDGRFVLRAMPNQSRDELPVHLLVLEDSQTGRVTNLMPIERNVDVGWGWDSKQFFLNDNFASDSSDCEIYRVPSSDPSVSIADEAAKKLTLFSDEAQAVSKHLYFSCVKWTGKSVLVVVYGHFDAPDMPKLQDRFFLYDLSTGKFAVAEAR